MARGWDAYSRQGLDIASAATSIGFSAAKLGTRLGFSIARNVVTTAVGLTTSLVDLALFGGSTVTSPLLGGAVSTAISLAEQITLAPIHLSEYITATSLLAAHSSINVLSVIFPGSSDASFSLASFITLVKREWMEPPSAGELPERQYGITQVARAIVAWVALQGVTQQWQEQTWFKYLREIDVKDAPPSTNLDKNRPRRGSRVRVTSDVIFPGDMGAQIIAADIGEAPSRPHDPEFFQQSKATDSLSWKKKAGTTKAPQRTHGNILNPLAFTPQRVNEPQLSSLRLQTKSQLVQGTLVFPDYNPPQLSIAELKSTLRRLSKMVLAGYGGASLLFFGVAPTAVSAASSTSAATMAATAAEEKTSEEACLTKAIDASEAEAAGEEMTPHIDGKVFETPSYSWWDILLGKHDQEIFERSAGLDEAEYHGAHHPGGAERAKEREKIQAKMKAKMRTTAVIGSEHLMPRFWVLTDHNRGQIVLVLRGTMSLNEIAVDLTCEPVSFRPATTPHVRHDEPPVIPGQYRFPTKVTSSPTSNVADGMSYHVHGGMLRMARAMGDVGKSVQLAVQEALHHNPGFELVLCGHSLGAGVAALLGMMWADPRTCLTVPSSGLPVGRRVYVYCFAPPCLTDPNLSKLGDRLIVSFVYSHDVVARLSLGSVRDLRNAAMWLCEAEAMNDPQITLISSLTSRVSGSENSNGQYEIGRQGEGWSAVTRRAEAWKAAGSGRQEEMDWFIAVRKTLEANMQNVNMFPPGRVLWAMRDSDLHFDYQLRNRNDDVTAAHGRGDAGDSRLNKLRLFEVLDVEKVFSQIVFAKDMLTAHMPHQYDQALHDLL
ncbi:hypothetical protein AX17_006033 [Amanita inopinata Kibby_2008]|nr:hypothetical protein AX17_006033 [Amanita inopinata Kibby_2008]